MKKILILILIFQYLQLSGTTWNEPWQEEIIKKADYFIKGKIIDFDENSLKVQVIKTFGEEFQSGELEITNFYLLDLCSISGGSDPNFEYLEGKDQVYFFLKLNKNGSYSISTPTSGYATIEDNKVYSSYRHSYHQALISMDIYEQSMTAIWKYYHDQPYNKVEILRYIEEQLSKRPAGITEADLELFFKQHVALELLYHLKIPFEIDKIEPFLGNENFHSQVSAIRALVSIETSKPFDLLIEVLKDPETENFSKTIAIETLENLDWKKYRKQLKKASRKISNEKAGFGGNLMDPRICTRMDSPKEAMDSLLSRKRKRN